MLTRESQVPDLLLACPGLGDKAGLGKNKGEYKIYAWVFKNPVKYDKHIDCRISGNPSYADLSKFWSARGDFALSYTHNNRMFTAGRFKHVIISYVHLEDAPRTRGTLAHCKWSLRGKVWRSGGGEGESKILRKSNHRVMAVSMLFLQLEGWPAMDRTPQFSMFMVSASLCICALLR